MRVQLIQYRTSKSEIDGLIVSPLDAPRAMDDFDINIIDLSDQAMWTYQENLPLGNVDCHADLGTIKQMASSRKQAKVIYVLPQNVRYKYNMKWSRTGNNRNIALKNILTEVQKNAIEFVIPSNAKTAKLGYGKTGTMIAGDMYDADFHFINFYTLDKIITKSEKSMEPTTVEIASLTYMTTLNVTQSQNSLKHFIKALFSSEDKIEEPAWIKDVCFGDDDQQNRVITECKREIEDANHKIEAAENKLKENAKFKSILYTNGEQLVSVVFQMLENILSYNLDDFVDKKREDFLIKKPECTFIGEIKGVTSNVKYEHISQLELHYRGYLDKLAETGTAENVKQLLIINPFRLKPPTEREPIHTDQIALAERNGCLIIETGVLLRIYERFCQGETSVEQCMDILANKTGLLQLSDFDEEKSN